MKSIKTSMIVLEDFSIEIYWYSDSSDLEKFCYKGKSARMYQNLDTF